MQTVRFAAGDIEHLLDKMDAAGLDQLPFGAIQLDAKGTILAYNLAEGSITGRNPALVKGRNFFRDVAPCTDDAAFRGRFDEGVRTGALNIVFEWVFTDNMAPTKVRVHMKKAVAGEKFWLFVKRL